MHMTPAMRVESILDERFAREIINKVLPSLNAQTKIKFRASDLTLIIAPNMLQFRNICREYGNQNVAISIPGISNPDGKFIILNPEVMAIDASLASFTFRGAEKVNQSSFILTIIHELTHLTGSGFGNELLIFNGKTYSTNLSPLNEGFTERYSRSAMKELFPKEFKSNKDKYYDEYVSIVDRMLGLADPKLLQGAYFEGPSSGKLQMYVDVISKLDLETSFRLFRNINAIGKINERNPKVNLEPILSEISKNLSVLEKRKAEVSSAKRKQRHGHEAAAKPVFVPVFPQGESGRLLQEIYYNSGDDKLDFFQANRLVVAVYNYLDYLRFGVTGKTNPPGVSFSKQTVYRTYPTISTRSHLPRGFYYKSPPSQPVDVHEIINPILLPGEGNASDLTIYPTVQMNSELSSTFMGSYSKYLVFRATELYFKTRLGRVSEFDKIFVQFQAQKLLIEAKRPIYVGPAFAAMLQRMAVYEKALGGREKAIEKYFSRGIYHSNFVSVNSLSPKNQLNQHLYFENYTTFIGISSLLGENISQPTATINVDNYTFGQFEKDFNSNKYVGTLKLLSYAVPSLPPFYRMVLASNLLVALKVRGHLAAQNAAYASLCLSTAHGTHLPLANDISNLFYPEHDYGQSGAMAFQVHYQVQQNIVLHGSGSDMLFSMVFNKDLLKLTMNHLKRQREDDSAHINRVLLRVSRYIGSRSDGFPVPSISDGISFAPIEPPNDALRQRMQYYWNKQPYSRGSFTDSEFQRMSRNLDTTLVEAALAYSFVPHVKDAVLKDVITLSNSREGPIALKIMDLTEAMSDNIKKEKAKPAFIEAISRKMDVFRPGDILFGSANYDGKLAYGILDAMRKSGNAKSVFLEYANMTTECCLGTNHFGTYLK